MRTIALAVLAFTSTSCVIHVHVHEDGAEPAPAATASAHAERHHEEAHTGTVSGVVVDEHGAPIGSARIALVGADGGSVSMSAGGDGRFDIAPFGNGPVVVHASTEDGRVAVRSARGGESDLRLVLRRGGTLRIDLASDDDVRCAVFQDHLRIEDFTLRGHESATVVVPAGEVRVRLYDGDEVHVERHFDVEPGHATEIQLQLDT